MLPGTDAGTLGVDDSARTVVELDPEFGFRVRGQDLLHTLRIESDALKEHGASQSRNELALQIAAQRGLLHVLFETSRLRYIAETAIEFIACGCLGGEFIDVYANGLTVPCQLGICLDTRPQRRRYSIAPPSFALKSIVVQVRFPEQDGKAGVIVDTSFGVLASGQDCLPTVSFIDLKTLVPCAEVEEQCKAGRWVNEGFYQLSPYRRIRKPYTQTASL